MHRHLQQWIWAVAFVATTAATGHAAITDPGLPGETQYDGWDPTIASAYPGYPGFPGSGAWPNPLGSNTAGSGDAGLVKVANGSGGGPFPATDSLYFGGFSNDPNVNGGTVAATDATPVANLATVVFQINIGEGPQGHDFFNAVLPVLNYNGGSQAIVATLSDLVAELDTGETFTNPETNEEEPIFINTWMVQWDLSSIVDPVTSFSVQFTAVQHAQVYAVRLDQYAAIPEPAGVLMLTAGSAGLLRRRRGSR